MKPDKSAPDNQAQKEAVSSNGIGSSLSIGLSLGVLIGIIIDDIGLVGHAGHLDSQNFLNHTKTVVFLYS